MFWYIHTKHFLKTSEDLAIVFELVAAWLVQSLFRWGYPAPSRQ